MSEQKSAVELLMSQGMTERMAQRILSQLDKENKPKGAAKKKGHYFPGMSKAKKKVTLTVDVLVVCECCGATSTTTRQIEGYEDSPKTMKVATSICSSCPDHFRQFTHEQLVALLVAKEHPGIKMQYKMNRSHENFAKRYTPEEIVQLKLQMH